MSGKKQKTACIFKTACGQIFNKLTLHYFLFGLVAVAIKFIGFEILNYCFGVEEVIANTVAWVIFTVFSYFTCRKYVFKSDSHGFKMVAGESSKFILFKLVSLILEAGLMALLAHVLIKNNGHLCEIIVISISSVFNYFANRLVVFRKKDAKS